VRPPHAVAAISKEASTKAKKAAVKTIAAHKKAAGGSHESKQQKLVKWAEAHGMPKKLAENPKDKQKVKDIIARMKADLMVEKIKAQFKHGPPPLLPSPAPPLSAFHPPSLPLHFSTFPLAASRALPSASPPARPPARPPSCPYSQTLSLSRSYAAWNGANVADDSQVGGIIHASDPSAASSI